MEYIWLRIGSSAGCCEHGDEPLSSHNLYWGGVDSDSVTDAVSIWAVTEQICSTVTCGPFFWEHVFRITSQTPSVLRFIVFFLILFQQMVGQLPETL